jgi:hypothetical protein
MAPCEACAEKDREIARLKKELADVVRVYKNDQGPDGEDDL